VGNLRRSDEPCADSWSPHWSLVWAERDRDLERKLVEAFSRPAGLFDG
jgi:hypothetical protein